ncbi:myb-like protein X isoform X1 [Vespula pensylvanica]|uniref:myb-like protein X isoform X1 n=3 Tax=Vespula pensylvanica TaxID=30213 RepID=UPI001CBA4340|nr:myb-like protein X isoform X1 [Vespula pensylvanica]
MCVNIDLYLTVCGFVLLVTIFFVVVVVMKHQQITVDISNMVYTAFSYLALAGAVWIFLRLLQACFWLPRHLKKQNDVQQMLQDKVDSYERYILECEEKEKTMILGGESTEEQNIEITKKWMERRECLEMLKQELKKIQDGDEIDYQDYISELEEEVEEENKRKMKEEEKNEKENKCTEEKISSKHDGSSKQSEEMELLIGKKEKNEKEEEKIKKHK